VALCRRCPLAVLVRQHLCGTGIKPRVRAPGIAGLVAGISDAPLTRPVSAEIGAPVLPPRSLNGAGKKARTALLLRRTTFSSEEERWRSRLRLTLRGGQSSEPPAGVGGCQEMKTISGRVDVEHSLVRWLLYPMSSQNLLLKGGVQWIL